MRLTDKIENENNYCLASSNYSEDLSKYNEETEIAINKTINKLGHVEDIEEKHNIKSIDDLDKRLIALEIIKNKGLHHLEISMMISSLSYEEYSIEMKKEIGIRPMIDAKLKTQEEFDLIKKVLL